MIHRDRFGYFHDIPDHYGNELGEVVYDGLGNPLGFLPFLAALAPLAAKVLPMIASALPMLARGGGGRAAPRRAAAPPVSPPPPIAPAVIAPPSPPQIIIIREPAPAAPSPFFPTHASAQPMIAFRGRRRRGGAPVRLTVERAREQMSLSPSAMVRLRQAAITGTPPGPPPPQATEASGGMGGVFYGPFGHFF
jgi:hypothetical protein